MRVDNRLDARRADGVPMRPLACERCAAEVLVRKSSWQQTSVQWTARATAACAERDAADGTGGAEGAFEGCRSLRDTIREAALRGGIEVVDPAGPGPDPDTVTGTDTDTGSLPGHRT
ncbi:ferredoxin [Streptomyces coelicoflavus]|uniref:ferredoxin n=1 Tax=Streptomyces coelicoflavus TaxID=285562 RepID=UPI0036370AA8